MKLKEDTLVIIRGIRKRPVESLLLILGIALGIGAAASGISIVAQTQKESAALLRETRYREIVVKTRETSSEMELPASQVQTDNQVFITANDLIAKKEIPAIEYAYVANRTQINFRAFRNMMEGRNNQQLIRAGEGEVVSTTSTTTDDANRIASNEDIREPGGMSEPEGGGPALLGEGGPPPEAMNPDNRGAETLPTDTAGHKIMIEELTAYEVSPEYFAAYGLSAEQGSLFTDDDIQKRQPLAILGSEIAKTLFEDGIALNREIQVRRELIKIVGILKHTGTDLDMAAFTPVTIPDPNATDPRLRFGGWNTNLRFALKDASKLDVARAQLTSWFEQAYGIGSVVLSVPREEAQELADRNSRLVTIILILAISGLLIASVNVSNILYSRALRKRKSIGILKAMGADSRQIFSLFFKEALMIGVSGAVFGALVGVLLSGLMKTSLGIGGYSIGILGLGILISFGTTLFLTNIPAVQTSKIPASEAIRYE